jgi:hypothetical protein
MTEPLAVDPSRLSAIGAKLASLVFPKAPTPMSATGSDPVSAAINATMPNLESLVSDGLPGVKAALTKTATNISNAADTYTKSDQALGAGLRQAQFGPGMEGLAGAAGGVQSQFTKLMGGTPLDKVAPLMGGTPLDKLAPGLSEKVSEQVAELSPRVEATVPQLVQLAPQAGQMAQQGAPMMMQTVSQMAGQAGSGGSQAAAAPAQLVSDTKKDGEDTDKESDPEEEARREGAAAGTQNEGRAPTQGGTGGKPPASPTATTV